MDEIAEIDVFPVSIPREVPYLGPLEKDNSVNSKGYFIRPGNQSVYHVSDQSVLVKITTRSGKYGWGECVGFVVPEAAVSIIRELIAPLLIGKDPYDVVQIYEDLYNAMRVRGFFGGYYHDAIAAVDIALWDLKGKLLGLPICKLLGSRRHPVIPAYVSGLPKASIPERAALAREWMDKGFAAFKFAAAVSHDGIVAEMEALRESAGDEAKILIDMHWKFTAAEAISLISRLEKYNLFVAEAPVKPEDIKGQALVVRSVKTPVAIGEELRTVYEYRPRFEEGCMHVIQPEMGRTGITSFWNICQLALACNVTVMPHASIGIGIFQAASLQVSASLPNLVYHEYQHSIFDKNLKYIRGNMRCEAGYFHLPEGPGLGVEPSEEVYRFLKAIPG
jgi:L-alanine-DL-glutamate epimerase-like enolase superfamily enzyme